MSGTSTTLNESLINNINSSSQFDTPERKRAMFKNIAKAYQTASEDDDDDHERQNSRIFKNSNTRGSMYNNTTRASIQNSTRNNSNAINVIPEQVYESPSTSENRRSFFKKNRHTSSDYVESDSHNEMGELSDDLLDDVISNHSTPSR